jgi:choline dehydrogenase-like flavoprotein
VVNARVVVLACTAIETARLLLSSRSSKFPDGLANRNGRVGKGLWFSTSTLGRATFAAGEMGASNALLLSAQRSIQDFYFMDTPIDGVRKGGTLSFLVPFVEPIALGEASAFRNKGEDARLIWGADLKAKLRTRIRKQHLQFESFCEFYTNDDTYVDLDPVVKDRWGAPVARITLTPHAKNKDATALIANKALQLLEALEPEEAVVTDPHSQTKFLQGGTCRFGDDPATTVLDRTCRAHDVPNLYVTDGSFMPTSGGVPPTLTFMANSFRVASAIARRFREGAL